MFNYIIINKDNLISNIKQVKKNNPNSLVCAMVKANAYGVGQEQVVKILNDYVDYFGVACFFEAQKLKELTNKKILIVGSLEKGCVDERFSYTCSSLDDVNYLVSKKISLNIHLKINTGMNRYGFKSLREFKLALKKIKKSKLCLEGVFTHFATDDSFVDVQFFKLKKFLKCVNEFKTKPLIHADNSIVQETFNHKLDMVRVGFCLYNQEDEKYLSPVEIKSQVVQINNVKKEELVGYNYRFVAKQNMKVAILPMGYADGVDLRLIGFDLVVNGTKCKILNICMDCMMLDVTKIKIKKGDCIYLINKDNSLKRYAQYLRISEYQVMCNFSSARAIRSIMSAHCEDKQN